jgi:hypothetical protein
VISIYLEIQRQRAQGVMPDQQHIFVVVSIMLNVFNQYANTGNAYRLLAGIGLATAVREVYIFTDLSVRRFANRLEEVEEVAHETQT